MRDEDDGLVRAAEPVDAFGDDLQRVDVEAGVGLVEQRQLRVEDRHLEDLVALLLAAGEALVDVALHQVGVEVHRLRLLLEHLVEVADRDLLLAAALAQRVERCAQELAVADAGKLDRVLQREEDARRARSSGSMSSRFSPS